MGGNNHFQGSADALPNQTGRSTHDLLERVYSDLRALAAYHIGRQNGEQTLPPTAVVHEAYLRLSSQNRSEWTNDGQFLSVASLMIRRILVDQARRRACGRRMRQERGVPDPTPTPNRTVDVTELDEALDELAKLSERQARVVELRYFGGLSIERTAAVLGVSAGTVKAEWRTARAWLSNRLGRHDD